MEPLSPSELRNYAAALMWRTQPPVPDPLVDLDAYGRGYSDGIEETKDLRAENARLYREAEQNAACIAASKGWQEEAYKIGKQMRAAEANAAAREELARVEGYKVGYDEAERARSEGLVNAYQRGCSDMRAAAKLVKPRATTAPETTDIETMCHRGPTGVASLIADLVARIAALDVKR